VGGEFLLVVRLTRALKMKKNYILQRDDELFFFFFFIVCLPTKLTNQRDVPLILVFIVTNRSGSLRF